MNGALAGGAQAAITAMISPALLILACASFTATALVRLARVVDRARKLAEAGATRSREDIARHRRRALLAEWAVTLYFFAAAVFVVAGLVIGFAPQGGDGIARAPVAITGFGMAVIVAASVCMLVECRLAATQIRAELDALTPSN